MIAVGNAEAVALFAAERALGQKVELASRAALLDKGFGEHAYSCTIADSPDAAWSGALVVHLHDDAAGADRRASWHRWAADRGFPAPNLLGATDGGVVVGHPGLEPSAVLMERDPDAIAKLTAVLGRTHARLHAEPVMDAPGPIRDPYADIDSLGGTGKDLAALLPKLRERSAPVACHGGFTPWTMHLDAGDHRTAAVTDWADACVGDAEYDVAYSELALWSSAYLSPDLAGPTMLKLIRGYLVNGYLAGYRAVAQDLDPARHALWGAYHALRVAGTVTPDTAPYDTWDRKTAEGVVARFRRDLRKRAEKLIRGGSP